jgi:hypothetical protein
MWGSLETNRIYDPTGFRIVDFRDGQNHNITNYGTNHNTRNYSGFNFSVQSRPTESWYFLAYYTLSWLWGRDATEIPTQTKFQSGFLDRDFRHRLNLAGSYTLKAGFIFGVKLEHTSGASTSKRFRRFDGSLNTGASTRYRSPQGTDPGTCSGTYPGLGSFTTLTTACGNNVNLISELRTLPQTIVDLQVEYDFYPLLRQHIALGFELLDLFNERTADALDRDDAQSGNFGYASGHGGGFQTRVGVRWDF